MHAKIQGSIERALDVLAGGCDSPVRSGWGAGMPMFVQAGARGAYAFGEDGRRYIDYIMAYGPLLFGHTHPQLVENLDEIARDGFVWGSTHPQEVRLAERIRVHLPSMERLRFVSTGTEAVMSAIRVARAYTGRLRVLKFAGDYHGHSDFALIDAGASAANAGSGIPASIRDDVLVARYNDLESVDRVLGSGDVAAIIVEPIGGNMGLVQPVRGFLEGLRQRANDCDALLVFDEVITWPRFGLRGAQGRFGMTPDLTVIGKIMGGGAPIAAFGGGRDIMQTLAPSGSVFTGGTHGGNPFCVAMAHRVLDLLESHPEYYEQMDACARHLANGLRSIFERLGLPYSVVQLESVVDFKFRAGEPIRDFDQAREADRDAYGAYCRAMFERGILLAPSQNEVMFVSTAHTSDDIEETLAAAEAALRRA